jgi:hypothetical protein
MQPSLFTSLQPQAAAGSDVAYTPDEVAEACVGYLIPNFIDRANAWWDPCAGAGAFARALQKRVGPGHATELDPNAESVRSGLAVVGDALQGPPAGCAPVLIATNPPFSLAAPILRMALEVPTCEIVALLLLQSWIVPDGQGGKFRRDLVWGPVAKIHTQAVLYPRICFGGPGREEGGTDQREYAWCIWVKTHGRWYFRPPAYLDRIVWRKE